MTYRGRPLEAMLRFLFARINAELAWLPKQKARLAAVSPKCNQAFWSAGCDCGVHPNPPPEQT